MLGTQRRRLNDWVAHGLITASQADAITQYEGKRSGFGWAAYGIAAIGVTAIVTGIISLIAANWDAIPAAVKIGAYFALLGGVGVAAFKLESRGGLAREVLITLFALLPLAGIGLVGQIYHLSGDGWSALLFWLSMVLPVTLLARSRFINHVWYVSLLLTAVIWLAATVEARGEDAIMRAVCIMLAAVLVLGGLGQASIPALRLPRFFREALATWSLLLVIVGSSLLGTAFTAIDIPDEASETVRTAMRESLFVWVGAVLYGVIIQFSQPPLDRRLRVGLIAMVAIGLAFCTLPIYGVTLSPFLGAICFILLWSCAAAAAVFSSYRRLFDLCTFVIGGRLVVVYFEIFGSMVATGLGLILTGVMILAVVYAWYKYRGQAFKWLEAP